MEAFIALTKEKKLSCCNSNTSTQPTEVCVAVGCHSRLMCKECKPIHLLGHKSVALEEYLLAISTPKKGGAELFQISKKNLEKETLLTTHQTDNLQKTLKKFLKTLEHLENHFRGARENLEANLNRLFAKPPSQMSNASFTKAFDLITAARVGQTGNFQPDLPTNEWTMIIQFGEKFIQEFREIVDKMLPEIDKKSQLIAIDGTAIKPTLKPFIQKYISPKSSYKQEIEISSRSRETNENMIPYEWHNENNSVEEENPEDLTLKIKLWQEDYKKIVERVDKQGLEIEDIDILLEKAKNLSTVLTSKEYKFLEESRGDYSRLEKWFQKAKEIKQSLFEEVGKLRHENIDRYPQHPKRYRKHRHTRLQFPQKLTFDEFIWARKDIICRGFKKIWQEYQEVFRDEENFIKDKDQAMQQVPAREYKALKERFLAQVGLVFETKNFEEEKIKFLQAWELYKEIENFTLYLKSLEEGVKRYVTNNADIGYLEKFPTLKDANILQEKIRGIRVAYPQDLVGELEEQIGLAEAFILSLNNGFYDSTNFEEIVNYCNSLKLEFKELEDAKKKYLSIAPRNSKRRDQNDDTMIKREDLSRDFESDDYDFMPEDEPNRNSLRFNTGNSRY